MREQFLQQQASQKALKGPSLDGQAFVTVFNPSEYQRSDARNPLQRLIFDTTVESAPSTLFELGWHAAEELLTTPISTGLQPSPSLNL